MSSTSISSADSDRSIDFDNNNEFVKELENYVQDTVHTVYKKGCARMDGQIDDVLKALACVNCNVKKMNDEVKSSP